MSFELTTRVEVYRTIDLTPELRQSISFVCSKAHEHDFSGLWGCIDEAKITDSVIHVLVYQLNANDAFLIAHGMLSERFCWYSPSSTEAGQLKRIRTAYVDAVSVFPQHQRHGYGTIVMRKLVEIMNENEYQLGALETDKQDFYTRMGWQIWQGSLGGLDVENKQKEVSTPEFDGHVLVYRLQKTPEELYLKNGKLLIEKQPGRYWSRTENKTAH
ncbi:unnamed protein product [Didymodactylos carnosus]|uniref:N-acetyltransferase domain-containing protein n=1 Tax=Didymodactylos carnosus TaxID=1234261 RepID=A0A8S2HPQ7_9BILA|nr:unnamed protein product [Didymodactylos carnosus]CAF3673340.1 unnamed protein product [Didymodactylos carnosus]